MSRTIAVAGKGGTGKTTVSGLIIRHLVAGSMTPVLAVDADPNDNLNEILGIKPDRTVVSLVDELMAEKDGLPPGMTKERYLELHFQEAVAESSGFDLIAMGHPEREGCYCAANNMLRNCMDSLGANYPFIVMDNEAGMEHLSRRTTRNVDCLMIIANPAPASLKAARRIRTIADELRLNVKKTVTVLNSPAGPSGEYGETLRGMRLRIPFDPELQDLGFEGKSVFDLPAESASCKAIARIMEELGL